MSLKNVEPEASSKKQKKVQRFEPVREPTSAPICVNCKTDEYVGTKGKYSNGSRRWKCKKCNQYICRELVREWESSIV